jgi:hypothetical protein
MRWSYLPMHYIFKYNNERLIKRRVKINVNISKIKQHVCDKILMYVGVCMYTTIICQH